MDDITITIDEDQRQMVLMALAHLAVERRGWYSALKEIAEKMDNKGAPMFQQFFRLHSPETSRRIKP